jgi:hypothetical protein
MSVEVGTVRVKIESVTMDFYEWLAYGVENSYCSPQVCATHAGIPSIDDEDMLEDQDFCVHVVRLGTEEDWQEEIDSFRDVVVD